MLNISAQQGKLKLISVYNIGVRTIIGDRERLKEVYIGSRENTNLMTEDV